MGFSGHICCSNNKILISEVDWEYKLAPGKQKIQPNLELVLNKIFINYRPKFSPGPGTPTGHSSQFTPG